jgi:uncharacterized membrane-anchored protein YjiN (DUF445 family)
MSSPVPIESLASGSEFRVRTVATGLLILMALLFAIAVIAEPAHPSIGWLRAFAEAAMVGALADWYAVTALFKRPLGLPIPHTAIIQSNRERIAARIGTLTQHKLMTPEGVAKLVSAWDVPRELAAALLDDDRRQALSREICHLLTRALHVSDNAAMQRLLRELGSMVIREVHVSPLAGQVLSTLLHSSQRDRLLHDIFMAAADALETNRGALSQLVAEKLPWSRLWSFVKLDEAIARKIIDAVESGLRTMRDNPEDAMRAHVIERLEELAKWLQHSEEARVREALIKEKLLGYDTLLTFFDESWHRVKQWMLDDMDAESSEVRAAINALLAHVGRTLHLDAELRAMLHDGLQAFVQALAEQHSNTIGELVTKTVRDWSSDQMVDTIEREVGHDLQFIRINGTIVGGLVGLLLHAIALLLTR